MRFYSIISGENARSAQREFFCLWSLELWEVRLGAAFFKEMRVFGGYGRISGGGIAGDLKHGRIGKNRIMDWRTAEKIEHLGSRANACGMAKHAAQDLRRAALEWGSGDANIFRQNARHVRNFAREAEGGRGGGCQFDSHGARLVRLDLRTAFSRARADCAIVRTCIYVFAIDWYRDILAPKFLV